MKKKQQIVELEEVIRKAYKFWQKENYYELTDNLSLNQAISFINYLRNGGEEYEPEIIPQFDPVRDPTSGHPDFKEPCTKIFNLQILCDMLVLPPEIPPKA